MTAQTDPKVSMTINGKPWDGSPELFAQEVGKSLPDGRQVTSDGEMVDEAPSTHAPFVHPWGLRPPPAAAFGDDIAFLPAPELERRADELIQRYPEIGFLASLSIGYLWKAAGGKSGGKLKLGYCKRSSGELAFYSELDFIVALSADHVRDWAGTGMTEGQVEALLYHELLHIEWDDEADKAIVRGHDLEEFRKVVERYGLWLDDTKAMDVTFRQLRLNGAAE